MKKKIQFEPTKRLTATNYYARLFTLSMYCTTLKWKSEMKTFPINCIYSDFPIYANELLSNEILFLILPITVISLVSLTKGEDFLMDTREGENIVLKCRFNEAQMTTDFSYYWARISGTRYENVAIGATPLSTNYG